MPCCPCSPLLTPTLRRKAALLLQRQMLHCVLHGQALLQNPLKSESSGKRSAIVWLCSWYLLARQGQRLGVPTHLRRADLGIYSPSLISLQCVMMFCPFSAFGCCCSSLHWIPQSAASNYISVRESLNRVCWHLGFAEEEGGFGEASSKRASSAGKRSGSDPGCAFLQGRATVRESLEHEAVCGGSPREVLGL